MIPKIIHCVWVGPSDMPESMRRYIETWKKYCPDYKIVIWDNSALDHIDNRYVHEAFQCGKWAFVSDYLRLYALYEQGGFYFDSDLELTGSLEQFHDLKFCIGFETRHKNRPLYVQTALIGAEKENDLIADLLRIYDKLHFIKGHEQDLTTNNFRITNLLKKLYGHPTFDIDEERELEPGVKIFPSYYFCSPIKDQPNFSIHHFDASWKDAIIRKDLLDLSSYSFIKIRRRRQSNDLPINKNEKIICQTPWLGKRKFLFLKKYKA